VNATLDSLPWVAPETGYEPEPADWSALIAQVRAELADAGSLTGTLPGDSAVRDLLTEWPGRGTCLHCWGKLGPRRRWYCSPDCRRAYEREHRQTETADFGAMVVRMVQAYGDRVAQDPADLSDLADLLGAVNGAIRSAVAGLRSRGYSWADIGRELGVSKQTAWERWGTR
jgi:hypothetical protein